MDQTKTIPVLLVLIAVTAIGSIGIGTTEHAFAAGPGRPHKGAGIYA